MGIKIGQRRFIRPGLSVMFLLVFLCLGNRAISFSETTESIPPVEEIDDSSGEEKILPQKLSIDLKGIDINELLKILSLKMGVTIVPSKNVSGRVNIFLNNLTYQDALDVILVSQNLACDRTENIINIMTEAEYEKLYGRKYNEKRKFRSLKLNYAKPSTVFNALSQIKSDIGKIIVDETSGTVFMLDIPERLDIMEKTAMDIDHSLQTEVFNLQYAKAEDIKSHLSGVITPGVGEVLVDSRSTRVVVSDLPEKMKKIRRIINAFDTENPQVVIETKIVEISLKDEFQREMNWERILNNLQKQISSLDVKGTFPVSPIFSASPALSAANLLLSMGTLADDDYTAAIKYLETFGDVKIISQPKIMVTNNQEAKIMVGTREAYVIQSLSQSTSSTVSAENIQFVDVGVKLNVMPTIHKDGFITMKIKPEVSSVREVIMTTLGSRIPIVDTSEVETVVKIKDDTMIMIAGMTKDENRAGTSGIPAVSRVPFLGALFGSKAVQKKRTEIVVFLTPRLVSGENSTDKKELDDWRAQEFMPDFPPVGAVLPKDSVLGTMSVQQKVKGPKEY